MRKFMQVVLVPSLVATILAFSASGSFGQANNNPPPAGAILDLSGGPIPGGGNGTYQEYHVDFTAAIANTAITFAFREDPAYISFANASVADTLTPNVNLLQNGDFSGAVYTNNGNALTPVSWTFTNQYGAAASGVRETGTGFCHTQFFYCWYDGAVQAYDAISQTIPTTVGHVYHISFWVADNSGCVTCNFADVSTATIPGKNVTVYAQAGLPPPGTSDTKTVQFTLSTTPQTQIATVGEPGAPAAQSLALTLANVANPLTVKVTFFYEQTEFSSPGNANGIGIADGICEAGATEDPGPTQDFDCRLANTFGGKFTYQTLTNGDQVVPHIIPSHNNMGVWVRVVATLADGVTPAVAGRDYNVGGGFVDWYYAWNTNPSLGPPPPPSIGLASAALIGAPNPEYSTGWNEQNPQMFDRPGENTNIAFVKNITTYSKNCTPQACVGTADPGTGGRTITLNDVVIAAPPNPPAGSAADTIELQVPFPGVATFPYLKGVPMLVAFELENESTEKIDATALTLPHSVSVATTEFVSGKNVPVQYPRGFPTTVQYNPYFKNYYVFLSPAPYLTMADGTPYPNGTVFTLQINSDLLAAPKTANFVVRRDE